ncbi:MAG: FMN-binding protein [Holophaga sp.]|nr:FMN-binding protein [Holophaga sp.]
MIRVLAPLFLSLPLFAAFPTSQEAIALAFPGAQITRREFFLSEGQTRQVSTLAGTSLAGAWVVGYEARREGKLVGVGFFDTHRVRTLNETVLVAVSAEGRILRVEVVTFKEPQEYLAKAQWIKQFEGKQLDAELSQKKAIRPLSGATLTAQALTDAARRGLALQQVLYGGTR